MKLKASHRTCRRLLSRSAKFRESDILSVSKPGPSRILRPEVPNRYELVGTAENAATLYQSCGVGFGAVPLAVRLCRLASPKSRFAALSVKVNGRPVRAMPVPASCQPRTKTLYRRGAS